MRRAAARSCEAESNVRSTACSRTSGSVDDNRRPARPAPERCRVSSGDDVRYKIVDLQTVQATGLLYVLVHFWENQNVGEPDRINDFLMQLRPTGERIVTNVDGWYKRLSDGVFIDPEKLAIDDKTKWERETFDRDLPAEIKSNIEAYWQRAEGKGYPADHTDSRIERDDSDPHGVLARADVMALKDAEINSL